MTEKDWKELPGVLLPGSDDNPENDFAWLDGIDEDNCYTSLSVTKSYKTLDFGSNGFTGSVTSWHELLQFTAPDEECGVVFIRGDFPDNPESILARAQRRNQKGTWGLGIRINKETDYILENTPAQGMINLQWPCTRFNLVQQHALLGSIAFGSYTICSFIKDGTLYQIARIPPSNPIETVPSVSNGSRPASKPEGVDLTIDIGGILRFGCSSSSAKNAGTSRSFCDNYSVKQAGTGGNAWVLACESEIHASRLEMRLWIDRKPIALDRHHCARARLCHTDVDGHSDYRDEIVSLHAYQPYTLVEDKAVTIVTAFSLVKSHTPIDHEAYPAISSADVQNYLGVSDWSISAPYRLWSNALGQLPSADSTELNIVGRCVEHVLSVSPVPIDGNEHIKKCCKASEVNEQHSSSDAKASEITSITEVEGPMPNGAQSANSVLGENLGVALLQNIITPQVVDLSSTFWQVRLLVKAIKFLDTRPSLPPQADSAEVKRNHYVDMVAAYKVRLLNLLRESSIWVLNIIPRLKPRLLRNSRLGILPYDIMPPIASPRPCKPESTSATNILTQQSRRVPDRRHQDLNPREQKWFCALIVWYTWTQYPEIYESSDMKDRLWNSLELLDEIQNKDNDAGTSALDDSYMCFLRWYHSYSFGQICEKLQKEDANRFSKYNINLAKHHTWARNWHVKAEKSLRLFGQGRLVDQSLDFEVANLSMISDEIRIRSKSLTQPGGSALSATKQLIRLRPDTKELNPGRRTVVRWDPDHNMRSATPRPAPWELSCLAHHIPLGLDITNARDDCFNACLEFLLCDYTFMASWDQSKLNAVGEWWDIATSCIIASTILDDFRKKRHSSWLMSATTDFVSPNNSRKASLSQFNWPSGGDGHSRPDDDEYTKGRQSPKQIRFAEPESSDSSGKNDVKKILELLREKTKLSEDSEGFMWRKRQPVALYHADTTVQSLEDTPTVYKLKQTRDVTIRSNIRNYLKDNKLSEPPDWSLENIIAKIPATKVLHVSCFDLTLKSTGGEAPEIGIAWAKGRTDKDFWKPRNQLFQPLMNGLGLMEKEKKPGLWDLYFLGKQAAHPKYTELSPRCKEMLQDEPLRNQLLIDYQDSLFSILNDSMVDVGTKYRILFVKKMSPVILQALIYMWHTDALDTFDDHLGILSHFSNVHNQTSNGLGDVWITTITISHWRLQDDVKSRIAQIEEEIEKEEAKQRMVAKKAAETASKLLESQERLAQSDSDLEKSAELEKEINITTKFPPKGVSDQRNKKEKKNRADGGRRHLSSIRQLSMSLVFTGDRMGRSWTCSIVSELIDEAAVAGYTREITQILQMFIHQQYSGRILCFFLILGYLCESLSKECEEFTVQLDDIMGMDPMVLLKGIEWHKSDVALKELKKMIWGLEALRVFDDKLNRALEEIEIAKREMTKELARGLEFRHRDMRRDAQKVMEAFEKRRKRLENAHTSIQQRIEQSSRLGEGMASVISVEQNENISMLTWVTIAYLPLAFVAGVFSMGHGIVPEVAGWGTFGWLMAVFILGTIIFALSLQLILSKLRRAGNTIHNVFRRDHTTRPEIENTESPESTAVKLAKSALAGVKRRNTKRAARPRDIEEGSRWPRA